MSFTPTGGSSVTGFGLGITNDGTAPDHNVKVEVGSPSIIKEVICTPPSRIEVVAGGVNANYLTLFVTDLKPGEFIKVGAELGLPASFEETVRLIKNDRSKPRFWSESRGNADIRVLLPGAITIGPALPTEGQH